MVGFDQLRGFSSPNHSMALSLLPPGSCQPAAMRGLGSVPLCAPRQQPLAPRLCTDPRAGAGTRASPALSNCIQHSLPPPGPSTAAASPAVGLEQPGPNTWRVVLQGRRQAPSQNTRLGGGTGTFPWGCPREQQRRMCLAGAWPGQLGERQKGHIVRALLCPGPCGTQTVLALLLMKSDEPDP